jgi:hypothetical protein
MTHHLHPSLRNARFVESWPVDPLLFAIATGDTAALFVGLLSRIAFGYFALNLR